MLILKIKSTLGSLGFLLYVNQIPGFFNRLRCFAYYSYILLSWELGILGFLVCWLENLIKIKKDPLYSRAN